MAPMFEEEILYGLLSTVLTSIPAGMLNLASYVLTALALYTLANRRGLSKPWLAWIPVVNCWILGSLSDQYQYVAKGQNKSKRKWLLGLNIAEVIIGALVAVFASVVLFGVLESGILYSYQYSGSEEALLRQIMGPVLAILGLCLPLMGVAIAAAVLYFMALYDVYKSMDPANSVLFLVLSVLFGVTEPFFLFFNRNKDKGMPPRREEPQQEQYWEYETVPQEPKHSPQEPWEQENKDYL